MPSLVLVLGPVPPPFGGVSLHIVRFMELLARQGVDARAVRYTGTTRRGRIGKLRQVAGMVLGVYLSAPLGRRDVLHLHYGGMGYFLALAPLLALTPARKAVTFHSVRVIQDLEGSPAWIRSLAIRLLGDFDLFVAVRSEIGEQLRALGLSRPAITVMPAFLPPAPAERDLGRLPPDVAAPLESAQAEHRLQVCCAAYYLGQGYGHEDIYGVESLLATWAAENPADGRPCDLWVLVSNRPETAAQKEAESAIRAHAERIPGFRLHLQYGLPLIPVMARCSGFLRPSREDGDSVAIREALGMGVPVLASDVVARPAGVATFALGATGAFAAALRDFLQPLAPTEPGACHAILDSESDRFREFVATVVGQSSAR